MEIWKDIQGYEGRYQISNKGRVKSFPNIYGKHSDEMILKEYTFDNYKSVYLYKDGKRKKIKVHRLVAEAFVPNPHNLPQVNHKDESRDNNIPENLEWCDSKYNNNYGGRNKKISTKIKGENHYKARGIVQMDMDGNVIREWGSMMDIERNFNRKGVHSNVHACCNGKYEQAYGFKWRYKD